LLDLDAPVRTYLPALRLADESVAARVTVRQILNHSAGWLGEYFRDFGRGADAIARYVAGMAELPQLTPARRGVRLQQRGCRARRARH
jgi:CubicO group peptidase (beta-lactamase class C family)